MTKDAQTSITTEEKEDKVRARAGPLKGIRVLDFTNMLSGPYCTRLMADLGAQVIKIEPREGDHNRSRRPVRNKQSSFFGQLNCGKLSVVLDLKTDIGRNTAKALARQSDVIVENWRPSVANRLGVGYETLRQDNPRLIYCSISGFGQTGPKALYPAYAPIIHAASGYDLAQVEYQGGGRPANTGTFIADVFGGLAAFGAIQTALVRRQQCDEGQFIDVAMLDAMLNYLVYEVQEAQSPSDEAIRVYQPVKTTDGYVVVAPTSQKNFVLLAQTLGHPEWLNDPRFSSTRHREANWSVLMDLIEIWTAQRSGKECENTLLAAGVPCSRYQTVAEALQEPQLAVRGSLSPVSDPAGSYLVPHAPFMMPGLDIRPRSRVPSLGEDGEAVLGELLGYSAAQVRACAGDA